MKQIEPGDRRIAEARRAFMARLERTPEKHRRAVVEVAAAKGIGLGANQVDPYTSALAGQMAEAFKIQDRVEEAKAEIERLEPLTRRYRPNDPDYRARVIARRADLEQAIEHDMARYVALQSDTLESAKRKASDFFQEAETQAERARQRGEAIARAEAAAEKAELDSWAENYVANKRRIGKAN